MLQRVSGPFVATGGGNPITKCADCGRASANMGPDCWCEMAMRSGEPGAYQCVPLHNVEPWIVQAARNCGCDPERSEVGIALVSDLQRLKAEFEAQQQPNPMPKGYEDLA